MAESLSRDEIEKGIKKLINFGEKENNDLSPGIQTKTTPEGGHENLYDENKEKTKKKWKKKNKYGLANDDQVSPRRSQKKKHSQQQKCFEEMQGNAGNNSKETTDAQSISSVKHLSTDSSNTSESVEALKPGLIISVNENSKRSIVSYLSKSVEGTKAEEVKQSGIESPRESSGQCKRGSESKEKPLEDRRHRQKKKKKKGKKDKSESGSDEESTQDAKNTSPHTQTYSKAEIDAFALKFWKRDSQSASKNNESTDMKRVKKEEELSSEVVCQILERDKIFPLKKKSIRFPKARYFCRVCDYHMDTHEDVQRHGKDHRHQRRVENINIQDELKRLADPSTEHISALDVLLEDTYKVQHLSEKMLKERKQVVEKLESFIRNLIPDAKLQMFGSSYTGLGLVSSDVNVDLEVQKDHAKCLTVAFTSMKESGDYENVLSDFSSKVPCIYFTVNEVNYRLTISNDSARNTSRLLKLYSDCDPRFKKLAVVFRYWAKVCKIDRQDEGTLPAYSFYLLLVFFLQRCKPPVLPLLYQGSDDTENASPTKNKTPLKPEVVDFEDITEMASAWKSENTCAIGDLWLSLFKYYVLGFEINSHVVCIRRLTACTRAEKKWNSKKLAIEDPFSQKRNVTKSVIGFELFEYIWDCVRKAYRYFGQPTNCKLLKKKKKRKEKIEEIKEREDIVKNEVDVSSTSNKECVESSHGVLDSVIQHSNVDTETNFPKDVALTCKEESSAGAESNLKTTVECKDDLKPNVEPLVTGKNILQTNLDTDTNKLYKVARDFVDSIIVAAVNSVNSSNGDSENIHSHVSQGHPSNDSSVMVANHIVKSYSDLNTSETESKSKSSATSDIKESDDSNKTATSTSQLHQGHHGSELSSDEVEISCIGSENKAQYDHSFHFTSLTDGKGPAVYCSSCEKEGHLKQYCPDDKLPVLIDLPTFTKSHKEMLNAVLQRIPKEYGPTEVELRDRELIRCEIQEFIRERYQDAKVHLFGSSHNGFGFSHSDLDLCVTLESHRTGEGLNMVNYIEDISMKLKTHRGLYNVFPITTAKVPIIKFKHRRSQLEGDISMYNLLAIHNTKMVRMYAAIDSRVRILGYALKVFAKICDIGDASRGSLSSYAYVLMLIHYLQQCKPPVIPVLQELYKIYGPDKPEVTVDGWNVWFFDNLDTLPQVWLDYGKNKQSVGELWLGFFRYYTEEFNMKEQVVCCRQTQMLTKFEKLWNSVCIAIEDPFDLNHNLGSGLSRKMQQFIHKALIRGRVLYGNPRPDLKMEFQLLYGYFFETRYLTEDGPAPNDRCCRACNKIGHIAKECPVVRNRKIREEKDRKRKADMRAREDEKPYSTQGSQRNNANNNNQRNEHHGHQQNSGTPRETQAGQHHHGNRRVINRTISESNSGQYYAGKPMMIQESQHCTQRSMSVPSIHHGFNQFSPSCSSQGFQQHMNQMHQRPYHQGSPNAGINRALFNQQPRLPSGQSPPTSHQVPVSQIYPTYYVEHQGILYPFYYNHQLHYNFSPEHTGMRIITPNTFLGSQSSIPADAVAQPSIDGATVTQHRNGTDSKASDKTSKTVES